MARAGVARAAIGIAKTWVFSMKVCINLLKKLLDATTRLRTRVDIRPSIDIYKVGASEVRVYKMGLRPRDIGPGDIKCFKTGFAQ